VHHGAKTYKPDVPFGTTCKPGESGSCEICSWCPVEIDDMALGRDQAVLTQEENFTAVIKNHIEFPLYKKRLSNILESSNETYMYLASCLYNNETDPFCPVFLLGTILNLAGESFTSLAVEGGVISVKIEWDCNLDLDFMSNCKP
jgi:hypothetical protein